MTRTMAPPATATGALPDRPPLKIGIVSPYGYPHPGGVNEHVRHAYEAMRRMGHDVWIITSKYGKERTDEGRVIRLGTGFAFPANGSMGRVTLSWRFKERAREVLVEEFGQPDTGRIAHRAADQIHPSRTIDRPVAAGILNLGQVQRVLVPVRLCALLLHLVFLAGRRVVVVIAGEAGGHRHQVL